MAALPENFKNLVKSISLSPTPTKTHDASTSITPAPTSQSQKIDKRDVTISNNGSTMVYPNSPEYVTTTITVGGNTQVVASDKTFELQPTLVGNTSRSPQPTHDPKDLNVDQGSDGVYKVAPGSDVVYKGYLIHGAGASSLSPNSLLTTVSAAGAAALAGTNSLAFGAVGLAAGAAYNAYHNPGVPNALRSLGELAKDIYDSKYIQKNPATKLLNIGYNMVAGGRTQESIQRVIEQGKYRTSPQHQRVHTQSR